MDYSLAKQLKDAGFPQKLKHGCHFYYDNMRNDFIIKNTRENALYEETTVRPTLSELIEACGDETVQLTSYTTRISLGEKRCVAKCKEILGIGDTPEEAVAKLWIVLNKHE